MKTIRTLLLFVLVCAMILAAVPALAESAFTFRNGITFGLSVEQLVQAESGDPDTWHSMALSHWQVISPPDKITYADREAALLFFMIEDQMELIAYDFMSADSEEDYNAVCEALSAEFGENQPVSSAEVAQLMDCFSPGFYKEDDITSSVFWAQEGVKVLQFCYQEGSFVVMYMNPAWDYTYVPAADAEDAA